jgi:hypothetical protein
MTALTLHRSGPATERRIMVARTVRSEFTKVTPRLTSPREGEASARKDAQYRRSE